MYKKKKRFHAVVCDCLDKTKEETRGEERGDPSGAERSRDETRRDQRGRTEEVTV